MFEEILKLTGGGGEGSGGGEGGGGGGLSGGGGEGGGGGGGGGGSCTTGKDLSDQQHRNTQDFFNKLVSIPLCDGSHEVWERKHAILILVIAIVSGDRQKNFMREHMSRILHGTTRH